MQPATEPAAGLLQRARRMGPLPYSARPPDPAAGPAPGPELAGWLVDAVDAWWAQLGCPDPFTVVDVGAGDGSRAAAFLGLGPECLTALRYVLVERDPERRAQHPAVLPIESPILVLGPVGAGDQDEDGDDEVARAVAGIGPLITSLADPPVIEGPAVVVATGWVSQMPSDRLEWRDGAWWEIRLAAAAAAGTHPGAGSRLAEVPVPLDEDRAAAAEQLLGRRARPDPARYAQLGPAVDWLAGMLRLAEEGWLAVVDRWTAVTEPLADGEAPPVALDQLASVRRPIEAAPAELFSGWSVVSWRLG